MRVCFISFEYPPNVIGGAGSYAETLVRGLRRRGLDTFVISMGEQHSETEKTFRVPTSNSMYWRRLFFARPARSLFRKFHDTWKFDLVHFNEPHILVSKPKVPTVCTLHSTQVNEFMQKLASAATLRTRGDIRDFMLKGSIGSISDILTAHATDKIICPSSNLAALIRSYCLVDEEKTVVVPNGIDLEIFSKRKCEDATTCLKQYGLEEDNYVLFVGRLSVLKGVQYLIEAFRSFSLEHPNVKLAIVGSGDFESNLKRLAHGIRNIVFTGHVSSFKERKVLFENSLFVVVPSLYETFPMVLLEGMACSKAVIASNVGGIPSIIRHGKNGFLSRAGDHEDIAKFIKILYGDKRLRDSMGSLGRELVERNFSVDQMINQTLLVYQSLF